MPDSFALSQDSTETRILIVDDEPNIRSALVQALGLLDYSVDEAGSGHGALAVLERAYFDLMVLDLHLPDLPGTEVMQRSHQLHPELLVIVLTGRASIDTAIEAVKMDAVDYLRKPTGIQMIADTVTQALQKHAKRLYQRHLLHVMFETLDSLRHVGAPPPSPDPQTGLEHASPVYPLTFDRLKRQVTVRDNPVQLTESETAVLDSLMIRSGRVLSCRQLVHAAWGEELSDVDARSVIRPHISRLRRKLEINPKKPQLIRTVRQRGYLFDSAHDRSLRRNQL